jgi:hypothetical protein
MAFEITKATEEQRIRVAEINILLAGFEKMRAEVQSERAANESACNLKLNKITAEEDILKAERAAMGKANISEK